MPAEVSLVSPGFWLPLAAAVLFGGAAILMKRTGQWRIDIWRISFVSNLATALAFQLFLFEIDGLPELHLFWQPAVVAVLFIVGQVCTLISLTEGEISVAAPALGLKIVFVPIFLSILQIAVLPGNMWLACALATLAVGLLNYTNQSEHRGRVLFSFLFAAAGAAAYAMFDICVQQWVPAWKHGGFLPVMFAMSTLMSITFFRLFKSRLLAIPAAAWPYLGGSAVLFALQSLGIVCAIAWWRNAAAANVLYSTRGLWSLLFLWFLGNRLGIQESGLSPRVFAIRLLGAALLMVAISLLLQ